MTKWERAEYKKVLAKIECEILVLEQTPASDFDQVSEMISKERLKDCYRRRLELARLIEMGVPIVCPSCWQNPIALQQLTQDPLAMECSVCREHKLVRCETINM